MDEDTAWELRHTHIGYLPEYNGIMLRSLIGKSLHTEGMPSKYELGLSLSSSEESMGLSPDGASTRLRVASGLSYSLKDKTTNIPIVSGKVVTYNSYSTSNTAYSNTIARKFAIQNNIRQLARLIVVDLYKKILAKREAAANPILKIPEPPKPDKNNLKW